MPVRRSRQVIRLVPHQSKLAQIVDCAIKFVHPAYFSNRRRTATCRAGVHISVIPCVGYDKEETPHRPGPG